MARTKLCRKCKMEIPKGASKCPHCQSNQTSPVITLLAIIIVIGGVWLFFGNRNKSNTSTSNSSSSSQTAVTKSELEQEMEEKGYVWGNKSLNLAITKNNTCETSEYSTKITGVIYNASRTDYSYLQVSFALYNENDMKIGNAWTNIAGLKSGESWKFEATYLGKCSKYKLDELTGY